MSVPEKGLIHWHHNEDFETELPLQGGPGNSADPVIAAIGKFGWWQLSSFLILGGFYLIHSWSVIAIPFLNAKTEYWCEIPAHLEGRISQSEWRKQSSANWYDRCWVDDHNGTAQPCSTFNFDTRKFYCTLTSEWSLVCDDEYKKSLSQSIFFSGHVTGIILFRALTKRFGPKAIFVPMSVLAGICDLVTALAPGYEWFVLFRFFTAVFKIGSYEGMYLWLLETISGKWISVVSLGFFLFWTVSWLLMAPLAYFVRQWRTLMTIIAVPTLLTFVLYWVIPESPKWLLRHGKRAEAEMVVSKIVKTNKRESKLPEGWTLKATSAEAKKESTDKLSNIIYLFRYPELCKKTAILFVIWFSIASAYYSIAFNMEFLGMGGDIFINHLINGLAEIPGYLGAMLLLNYKRRRVAFPMSLGLISLVFAIGIALKSVLVDPGGWIMIGLVCCAKAVITLCFGMIFVYSAEIYPTTIRSTAIAASSCFARFGAMASPWIAMSSRFSPVLPLAIHGVMTGISCLLALLLPETANGKLPDTIEESEEMQVSSLFCGYKEPPSTPKP